MRKKQITCTDVLRHVCDELDGDIDSPRCRQLKSHLATCADCSAYLDGLKKTVTLYRGYPVPKSPRWLRKKLHSLLQAEHQTRIHRA